MKKLVIFLVLIMSLGFYAACDGGGGDSGDECDGGATLTNVKEYDSLGGSEDLDPYETLNLKFTATADTDYVISVTNIDEDVDWYLWKYEDNCVSSYNEDTDPARTSYESENSGTTDETVTGITLESRDYLLRIYNRSSTITDTVSISITH